MSGRRPGGRRLRWRSGRGDGAEGAAPAAAPQSSEPPAGLNTSAASGATGAPADSPKASEVAEAAEVAEVAAELATIDAAHAEIVLHRAIELADMSVVVTEQFPVAGLEEVAAELQMPAAAVAKALAEYRAGGLVVRSSGRAASAIDRFVGPRQVTVHSRTGLPEDVVVDRLSQWLKRRHRLRIRVNPEGTVVAIRRRGLLPVAMRQIRGATGSAGLSGLREVRGAAVGVDEGQTMICVVADLSEQRTQSVVAGSVVAFGGAAVVTTAAAITAPVTLVAVPVAVGAGWVVTRVTHRRQLRRVREEVQITTDSVASGARPSNRVQEVAERLTPRPKG